MLELCTNSNARTTVDVNMYLGLAIYLSYHNRAHTRVFQQHIQHDTVLTFVVTQRIDFVLFFGLDLEIHVRYIIRF